MVVHKGAWRASACTMLVQTHLEVRVAGWGGGGRGAWSLLQRLDEGGHSSASPLAPFQGSRGGTGQHCWVRRLASVVEGEEMGGRVRKVFPAENCHLINVLS